MFPAEEIEDRLKTPVVLASEILFDDHQQNLSEIKRIKDNLKTQITNLKTLLTDKVFKQQQQILSQIWINHTQTAEQLSKYHDEINLIRELIASENDANKKAAYIEQKEKLALTINTLNTMQSQNETTLNTLFPSMQSKILKGLALPPLKQIAANFIATHSILYNPTSIPKDVHTLANNAQQLAIINKYLMDLRIKFLSIIKIKKFKQLIKKFITDDNDLPPEDANFIIAIMIGDAASVNRILNQIEKYEIKKLTDTIDRYRFDVSIHERYQLRLGSALLEEDHSFYARVLWLFSRNFIENINNFPQICFTSESDSANSWDMPFDTRCDKHLWEIGNIVFNIFFSVLPKTIPIKKLMLYLACMYGRVDIVEFYCEKDPDKDILIQYLRNNNLASIAAQFVNIKIINYLMRNNIISSITLYHDLPEFISRHCATVSGNRDLTEIENERAQLIEYANELTVAREVITCKEEQLKQVKLLLQQKQQQLDELLKQQAANAPLPLPSDQLSTKRAAREDTSSDPHKKPKTEAEQKSVLLNNPHLLMPSLRQDASQSTEIQITENPLLQQLKRGKHRG